MHGGILSSLMKHIMLLKRGDRSFNEASLLRCFANRSDTLIMLTATPHDGKGQSVASLMNMLDLTAIADEENYTKG